VQNLSKLASIFDCSADCSSRSIGVVGRDLSVCRCTKALLSIFSFFVAVGCTHNLLTSATSVSVTQIDRTGNYLQLLTDKQFARALLSFKRPLLSVDVSVGVSVCVSATLMLNISETKRWGSCSIGSLWESAYGASINDVIDDVT